jgi:hypothetical protein
MNERAEVYFKLTPTRRTIRPRTVFNFIRLENTNALLLSDQFMSFGAAFRSKPCQGGEFAWRPLQMLK